MSSDAERPPPNATEPQALRDPSEEEAGSTAAVEHDPSMSAAAEDVLREAETAEAPPAESDTTPHDDTALREGALDTEAPTLRADLPVPESLAPPTVVVHAPRVKASISFLAVVTILSLAADLAAKGWAKARLSGFEPKTHGPRKLEIIKGHVEFIFAQNPGGAWSFLRSLPDSLRRPFFLVVSAAAIVFIVTIYQRVYRDQSAMKWGLPLALGGAMGNLVDRIRYGWVVDFIDVSMRWGRQDHHWPTFNVADIAIVVGVALMAIDMLRARGFPHDESPRVVDLRAS